jgi:CheY-like chemotaxis protein
MKGKAVIHNITPSSSLDAGAAAGGVAGGDTYMWPQFRDPALQDQYISFCDKIPGNTAEIVLQVVVVALYLLKMVFLIVNIANFWQDFSTGYYVMLSVTMVNFFVAGISLLVYSNISKASGPLRRRVLHVFFVSFIGSAAAMAVLAGLAECTHVSLMPKLGCVENTSWQLLFIGLAGPLLAHNITRGDFKITAMAILIALISQILVVIDQQMTARDAIYLTVSLLLCVGIVMRLESTRMSAFLGKMQEQHLKKLHLRVFETENEQLRAVLWNVAHDMKTPMQSFLAGLHVVHGGRARMTSAIKASSDYKLRRDMEGILQQCAAATGEMQASCELLTMQLNRAMDVATLENDFEVHSPNCSAVSVREVVDSVVNVVTTLQCNQTSIHVDDCPAELSEGRVCTARSWLSDNLLCMVQNAETYSPGRSNISLHCSICDQAMLGSIGADNMKRYDKTDKNDKEKKFLLFKITDCGTRAVDHSKMFSKLTQVERKVGGAGLGLYVCRLRVLCQGGACGSRPRADGLPGSVFFFAVPYEPCDDKTINQNVSFFGKADLLDEPEAVNVALIMPKHKGGGGGGDNAKRCSTATTFSSSASIVETECPSADLELEAEAEADGVVSDFASAPQRILVVDDSLSTLKLMARAFKGCDAIVATATDGQQALELMKSTEFALVIMDVQMPVMDGIESMAQFRAWEAAAGSGRESFHQYIVAASAVDCRVVALLAGADAFFDKPLNIASMIQLYRSRVNPV